MRVTGETVSIIGIVNSTQKRKREEETQIRVERCCSLVEGNYLATIQDADSSAYVQSLRLSSRCTSFSSSTKGRKDIYNCCRLINALHDKQRTLRFWLLQKSKLPVHWNVITWSLNIEIPWQPGLSGVNKGWMLSGIVKWLDVRLFHLIYVGPYVQLTYQWLTLSGLTNALGRLSTKRTLAERPHCWIVTLNQSFFNRTSRSEAVNLRLLEQKQTRHLCLLEKAQIHSFGSRRVME